MSRLSHIGNECVDCFHLHIMGGQFCAGISKFQSEPKGCHLENSVVTKNFFCQANVVIDMFRVAQSVRWR